MEVQPGKAIMINGLTNDIYTTEYPVKAGCMSHAMLETIVELPQATAHSTTLAHLLDLARTRLGPEAVLEFDSELVVSMGCVDCGAEEPVFKRMARLYENEAVCPACGGRREMNLTHRITGDEDYLNRTLAQVDVPPLAIIRARSGQERIYFELTGDKDTFLSFA
jgi:adenylyltransferase/sulfurtransferase